MINPITFCISTYNNIDYLKIAIKSVRKNSYFKDAPFIIHAENCTDGTNEWLEENKTEYNLTLLIEPDNKEVRGIGGGMNICAENVTTEYIMFLHSDFYVTKNWDIECLNVFKNNPTKKLWVSPHRVEPIMFETSKDRPGTVFVDKDVFGAYHYDFNEKEFDEWAEEFISINDFEIPKGEGVSGLIRKKDWDEIGGNDSIFSPTSWEDVDLFLRMLHKNYEFILTSKSMVWHFGARGSHRLEENEGKSSKRQAESELKNFLKFIEKWNKIPVYDEWGMIIK